MKEDLARRLKGYPCNFDEIVARTPEDQIFLNHIGDRYGSLVPMGTLPRFHQLLRSPHNEIRLGFATLGFDFSIRF